MITLWPAGNGRFWFRPRPQLIGNHRPSSATSRISNWRKRRPGPKDAVSGRPQKNPRTGMLASPGIYRLHQGINQWYAAGLLTRASPYSPSLPGGVSSILLNSPVASSGFRPHSQRRVRAGIAPASLLRPLAITSGRSPSPAPGTVYRFPNSGRSSIGRARCQRGSQTCVEG